MVESNRPVRVIKYLCTDFYLAIKGRVGLFFVVNGVLLPHTCPLLDSESYGDFLTYPESHDDVWQREYYRKYHVDFDYYPRGRVVYNQKVKIFTMFIDRDLDKPEILAEIIHSFGLDGSGCKVDYDEHYQCHICNEKYTA